MIHSTSSSDRTNRAEGMLPSVLKAPVGKPESDRFSAEHSATLQKALASSPEIRPEVVARGQALAADPNYPSTEILQQVGAKILNSPDFSEDQA